jgi:hypothetical protein
MENKEADVEYQQGHFKKEKILFVVYLVHHYLATRHSPLATRHSPLATRHSPLATRNSQLATRNSQLP